MGWMLLLISVPIFYVIGVYAVIKGIVGGGSKAAPPSDKKTFLTQFVAELSKSSPSATVAQLIPAYKREIARLNGVSEVDTPHEATPAPTKSVQEGASTPWLDNWYADNSINLLLYIGAFLIVASASIFVGFQWETIGGIAKVELIILLTVAFFGSGFAFYRIPKIKNAGSTFLGIGALLIPFCGIAWYNFLLKPAGEGPGIVWLITSVISLIVYIGLVYSIKNVFYTYLAGLSVISFMLSLVQAGSLPSTYYILTSIISCLGLLIVRLLFQKQSEEEKKLLDQPLEIISNLTLPLTMIYGLVVASSGGYLYSLEATAAVILGGTFYLITYLALSQNWALAVAESLYPLGYYLMCRWLGIPMTSTLYSLAVFSGALLGIAAIQTQLKKIEPSYISTEIGLLLITIVVGASHVLHLGWTTVILAGIAVACGGISRYIIKQPHLYLFSTIFLAVGMYLGYKELFPTEEISWIISLVYCVGAVSWFGISVSRKADQKIFETFGISSILYFTLSFILSLSMPLNMAVVASVTAVVAFYASRALLSTKLSYVGVLFTYVALMGVLMEYDIEKMYYPISFVTLSYILYGIGRLKPVIHKPEIRTAALVAVLVTPILFGLQSIASNSPDLERNSLISLYAAFILFCIDTFETRDKHVGYFASALGIVTYLWQIKYLHVTEVEFYTLPVGAYMLLLAYVRKWLDDRMYEEWLNNIGAAVMLVPPFLQSYGTEGYRYALLLGLLGAFFLIWGISTKYKQFIFVGVTSIVLAVFSQVAEYLYSLPRWMITGLAGVLVLGVAIYLLVRRAESSSSSS